MALELQPFMTMLDNYRRQHQRREQEESRQRPSSPPEWALRLNPDDFKGRTKEMLLAAQAVAPGTANQMGKGDLGIADEPYLHGPAGDGITIGEPDAAIRGGIDRAVEEERQRQQPPRPMPKPALPMEREAGTGRLAIQGFQPDRSHAEPAADVMDREAAEVKARRDQVAREDSVHPHAGADPRDQPRHFNLSKALGPHVGGPGDFVSMARQYRQTGELPGGLKGGGGSDTLAGGSGGDKPPAQAAAASPAGAWSAGQSPSAINASARRQMGGGLFGGNGPGLGYVLGGIGALLQEAGGRPGAVGQYVETYGERHQQQREANQTRQAAIDLGIYPEFARTAPISVLVPLLGPAYKQKHAPREPLVTRPGDIIVDSDSYEPLFENAKAADLPSDVRTAQYMFPNNPEAQRQWLSAKGHQQIQIGADGSVSIGPATGGLSKPTQTQIEKDIVHGEGVLETLDNVRAGYRPEFSTFAGRGQAMWSSLKAKGLGSLGPEEQKQLADYHNWASRSFSLLSEELNRLSGAAISPAEAERLKKAMPNPGTGPLDMDDPITYQAKLDRWEADLKTALRRNKYVLANGLAPDGTQPWRAMTSARFEAEFENEAAALSKQYQAQGTPEQEADMRAAQELAERYGF